MTPETKFKIKIIIFLGLLTLGSLLLLILRPLFLKPSIQPTPAPKVIKMSNISEQLKFKRVRYQVMPLLKEESSSPTVPAPRSVQVGRAKLVYLPLPNIFEGRVEAETIEQYRQAKKALVEELQEKDIKVCDLNIYWVRPKPVSINELTSADIKTDGCQ